MVNIIWMCMALIGIIYAMVHGTMDEVNKAIFTSASEAVSLTITLMSLLIFWLGMMKIAEKAGLLRGLAKLFKGVFVKLFPDIPKDDPALGYIVANFTANLFGLGSAATPMGLKAMHEMKRLSNSDVASRSMITFLALNTSGITLIPTTVIAIRIKYHATDPTEIVGAIILASCIATVSAIIFDRLFYYYAKRK